MRMIDKILSWMEMEIESCKKEILNLFPSSDNLEALRKLHVQLNTYLELQKKFKDLLKDPDDDDD
jgi:hypothetical protein